MAAKPEKAPAGHGPLKVGPGQVVNVSRWNDRWGSPTHELRDPVIVVNIENSWSAGTTCGSGWMITVEDANGQRKKLDQDWIKT